MFLLEIRSTVITNVDLISTNGSSYYKSGQIYYKYGPLATAFGMVFNLNQVSFFKISLQ